MYHRIYYWTPVVAYINDTGVNLNVKVLKYTENVKQYFAINRTDLIYIL